MAHDVFISHARKDEKIADAICEKLEFAEMRCCIAPRDISPGGDWTEATRKAIRSSRAIVLVFSENANASPHIEREIAHAFYTGRTIIPFRLAETLPRRDFLFYLGDVRWFDALGPDPEQHLEALTAHIQGLLRGPAAASNPLRSHSANKRTVALNSLNPWKDEVLTSGQRTQQNFKRIAIAASVFAVVGLLWLASRQIEYGALPDERDFGSMSSGRSTPLDLPTQPKQDPSAPTPRYAFTRLGLWAPVNPSPTPSVQSGTQDTSPTIPLARSASAAHSRPSTISQNAGGEAEEHSLKKLVLDYIRTVPSDDVSAQERFFAQRVSFYGEGVLSLPMIQAFMQRYRREWPIRNWEPRGEPKFPKILHSTNPELYEVLQPIAWTVANDSRQKQGNTTLYVRIRKNAIGEFRIIQVEQRDAEHSITE